MLLEVLGVGTGQGQQIGVSQQRPRPRVWLRGGNLPGQGATVSKMGYNWRSIAGFNDPAVSITRNVKNLSRKLFSC